MPLSVSAEAPLSVELCPGLSPAIDEAAAAADPGHHFLRRAWFEGAGDADALTLIGRRGGGQVIAALPTVPAANPRLGIRAVPGIYWPFRSFPVAQDATDQELEALLSDPTLRRTLGRAWRLGPVAADDPTALRLLRVARRSGWSTLKRSVGTFYLLDIAEEKKSGPWPRPSTVRNNNKHDKRLAKLGALEFRYIEGSGWTPQVFADLEAIERGSWVASRSDADAKFLDPRRRAAWEKMTADPVLAQMLSAGILYIGGEPASFSFGINSGATRYSIATSYDERFAKHSPGSVTGYRTYEQSVERGVGLLHLGSGDGGAKGSMGAVAGPQVLDLLFVRNPLLAALLRPLWRSQR